MDLLPYYFYLQTGLSVLVHVAFAVAVWLDSAKIKYAGGKTFLVPGWLWAIATLFGGIVPVIGYWFIHHSTLRRSTEVRPGQVT